MYALQIGSSNAFVGPSVSASHFNVVNRIYDKPSLASSSNLPHMIIMRRAWAQLFLYVKSQGHNGHILE